MRIRRPLIGVAVVLSLVLFTGARCGTLVQVVDEAGLPVQEVSVHPVWPSVTGEVSLTDAAGYARLHDGWSVLGAPSWVYVNAMGRFWLYGYPPPRVICLDPAKEFPLPFPASQQGAAADGGSRRR